MKPTRTRLGSGSSGRCEAQLLQNRTLLENGRLQLHQNAAFSRSEVGGACCATTDVSSDWLTEDEL